MDRDPGRYQESVGDKGIDGQPRNMVRDSAK